MVSSQPIYLSILIPVHNQSHLLKQLLASIFTPANSNLPFEVVVCDDGSQEPIESALVLHRSLRIIRHSTPRGAAAARNSAAEKALGEVFLFLDADTVLIEGSLQHLVARFQAEADLMAINGGADLEPANPEAGFTVRYRAMIDHVQQNIRAPRECSFFTPRCGAIRKEIFFKAGRFSESFAGATVEEYEFGHRLTRFTPIRFDRKVGVKHHYSGFWKNSKNYFVRVRAWMALFMKRRQFDNYGACTGSAGLGSILALFWAPGLLLPTPLRELVVLSSLSGFFFGYRDIFGWSLRLKGPLFFLQSVLLTWWLCCLIVPGAMLGALDSVRTIAPASHRERA